MDYPFQRSCEQPPPPLGKNRRKGVCGRGGDCTHISSSCVKTANKKISVSSVFNESEGLSTTTVCLCLVHRPHYSARLMRFGSRNPSELFSQTHHWNALTEIAWEDAEHGPGMAMATVASEKNRELLFSGNVFYKQWHQVLSVVSLVFRGTISWKSQILNSNKKIFAMEKN